MAKAARPIVDISQPGKSLPSDSSKPIVVTNRPMLQDPVLSTSDTLTGAPLLDLEPKAHVAAAPPSQKKVDIKPLGKEPETATKPALSIPVSAPVAADSIPEATPPAETPTPADADKVKPKAADSKPEPAAKKDDVPAEEDTAAEAAPVVDEKQLAAEAAQSAKVAELIKREVYVLPINAVEKRRSQHVIIGGVLLIIVLALVWLDLAADAGFIHVRHLPLTHFFRV